MKFLLESISTYLATFSLKQVSKCQDMKTAFKGICHSKVFWPAFQDRLYYFSRQLLAAQVFAMRHVFALRHMCAIQLHASKDLTIADCYVEIDRKALEVTTFRTSRLSEGCKF